MRIGFVGCGAIGSCYASYLSRKHEVCVLDTYAPVIESIKKNGILLDECAPGSGTGETVSFRPAMATTDPKEIGVVDLLIVFVHYQYLEAAVRNALPMIDRHTMILCLQNGLGNYDEIAKVVPEEQIIIGNTAFGATPMEPGHVKHTGTGVTNMGSLKAPKENVERMAEALREAAGEGGLACAEVPEVGDHIAGCQTAGQLLPQRLRFIGAVRGDLHHKSPLPAPLYLWHYTIPARQNQSAIGSPPKFCRNRLTRKLGGVIMATRKLGRGGAFMEKEDILEISRREHQNRDLAELEASVQAGNLAGRVGAGVCCLVSALFVRAVHTVLLGPWVIYFSILGTHALVKFLKLKRKTDLVLTVLYLVMFLLFLVFFIRRLMEAAE